MSNPLNLDIFFHPKSIAVVGTPSETPKGKWPGMYGCIVENGYTGTLYPINPKATEVGSRKAYPNLTSLPVVADLVILSVPAPFVPDILRECAATGHKNIHIFTAGFKETGEPEGLQLQEEIETIAREHELRVIGPNCMGVFVPKIKMATWVDPPDAIGRVAFLSQSGGHAQDFTNYGAKLGLGYSKVVSYGNALTLDAPDFLEYLAEDPDTDIIAMYLEGASDGRRLLETVRKVNQLKPVVILKAGLTESGTRAVASHTGSLAGKTHIWDAFFRQTGAIQVQSLQEMAHTVLALQHFKTAEGNGVAVLGVGGGVGVEAADACSRAGLGLPDLSDSVRQKLREYVGPAGNMIRNPIDAFVILLDFGLLSKTLDIISAEACFDMFILSIHLDWLFDIDAGAHLPRMTEYLIKTAHRHLNGKPLAVCWRTLRQNPKIEKQGLQFEKALLAAGIPVYRDLNQTAGALSRFTAYHQLKKQLCN